jgi:hypothetical protein
MGAGGPAARAVSRSDVESFFSDLHRSALRRRGFRKTRHRFRRVREGYVEHVVFDGSAWNAPTGPWRFHLDLAIELPDLPTRSAGWGAANARGRVRDVLPTAPDAFDLTPESRETLLRDLPVLVDAATAALGALVPAAREWARMGRPADLRSLASGTPPPPPPPA